MLADHEYGVELNRKQFSFQLYVNRNDHQIMPNSKSKWYTYTMRARTTGNYFQF